MIRILLVSMLTSYLLTPFIRRFALKLGAVDLPGGRRVNSRPIPNLGGIAIYGGLLSGILAAGLLVELKPVVIGATLILSLGIIDDLYDISAFLKLAGQIIISLGVIISGWQIEFIRGTALGWLGIPTTLFWLLGTINVINLIDGLDGLAGGVVVIAGAVMAAAAYKQGSLLFVLLLLALMGAVLGFLRYNFNPAQIFMGDAGSMLLGFVLGISAVGGLLKSVTTISFFIPFLALGIPILDTAAVIYRRLKAGHPILRADNYHFHHRLLKSGLTQKEAVNIIYLLSFFLGLIAIGIWGTSPGEALFLLTGAVSFLWLGFSKWQQSF